MVYNYEIKDGGDVRISWTSARGGSSLVLTDDEARRVIRAGMEHYGIQEKEPERSAVHPYAEALAGALGVSLRRC